jgi:hypothetical protein
MTIRCTLFAIMLTVFPALALSLGTLKLVHRETVNIFPKWMLNYFLCRMRQKSLYTCTTNVKTASFLVLMFVNKLHILTQFKTNIYLQMHATIQSEACSWCHLRLLSSVQGNVAIVFVSSASHCCPQIVIRGCKIGQPWWPDVPWNYPVREHMGQ